MKKPYIFNLKLNQDNRGYLIKPFSCQLLDNLLGYKMHFEEMFYSSSKKGVLRGMHFQCNSSSTSKLIFLVSGRALDVCLDIDAKSSTFGKYYVFDIRDNRTALYIPKNFAHGFLSLEKNTLMCYMQEKAYCKDSDVGILWNSFGFDWNGVKSPIISDRDSKFISFSNYAKSLNNR
jgi:dTDP-4-dehydrorhamnose 3,5-epimerase